MAKIVEPKETRTKTWTLVIYPESTPANWRDVIDEHHIPWFESPLHDRDLTATGEVKKPHWHILLMFGTLKSYDQVKELTEALNGPRPEKCHDARALVRYMAHLDDPNKAQYSKDEIIPHGGADLSEMFRPSHSELYAIIDEMRLFIIEKGLTEFEDIFNYAAEQEKDRWFPVLCGSGMYVMKFFLSSRRHRRNVQREITIRVDDETGEIV
jgi:Plasmid replication protein